MGNPDITSIDFLFEIAPPGIETGVSLKNVTTDAQTMGEESISLLEFHAQGFALEVPARSCATGHHLAIHIRAKRGAQAEVVFDATVRVDRDADLPLKRKRIEVTLMQFNNAAWEKLQALFSSRQAEIEEFFEAATGRR